MLWYYMNASIDTLLSEHVNTFSLVAKSDRFLLFLGKAYKQRTDGRNCHSEKPIPSQHHPFNI